MDLKNKRVAIIGGKRSGEALARLVVAKGGSARLSEKAEESQLSPEFLEWARSQQVLIETGGHTEGFVKDNDFLVLSPGVRGDSSPVCWARESGIVVLGEIEFAFQFCSAPIISVTGSNGKTTVSTLIDHVLTAAGYHSCLCGNIGRPFSEYVLSQKYDYFVLEVSSFQMETVLDPELRPDFLKGFKPHIGVFLNFTDNHLDRHADMEEYFQAKQRMFLNQDESDYAVLNATQTRISALAESLRSKAVFFGNGQVEVNPNYSAVAKVAEILEIDKKIVQDILQSFPGVEHRLEFIRKLNDIDFVNDSKSTTVEATRWALTRSDKPTILICGGRDKNLDYSVIRELVQKKVKAMILFGEAKEKICGIFFDIVDIQICDSLERAVVEAKKKASSGDQILLSPMCASFDMFDNFEHRGKVFKQIVNKL